MKNKSGSENTGEGEDEKMRKGEEVMIDE